MSGACASYSSNASYRPPSSTATYLSVAKRYPTLPPPPPPLPARPSTALVHLFYKEARCCAWTPLLSFFFSLRERRRETNDGSVNKRSIRIFISILLRKIAHLSLSRDFSISSKLNHGYPQRLLGQSHRRSSLSFPSSVATSTSARRLIRELPGG